MGRPPLDDALDKLRKLTPGDTLHIACQPGPEMARRRAGILGAARRSGLMISTSKVVGGLRVVRDEDCSL